MKNEDIENQGGEHQEKEIVSPISYSNTAKEYRHYYVCLEH